MLRKQQAEGGRFQVSVFSIDDLVPANHLVRKVEEAIDFHSSTM